MPLFCKYTAAACKKVCMLHTYHTLYYIYSTVGGSIASLSDLGVHIYLGTLCLGKYGASDVYTYWLWTSLLTIYITYTVSHTYVMPLLVIQLDR